MNIQEIQSKSILTKSKLPDTEYVINPYTGCQFGCLYCYASFMGRFVNEPIENWGNYVYVKINAVELFEEEIIKIQKKSKPPSILLSSVTDPYQMCEKKYRITRGILEILDRHSYQGHISILTKSPLVTRDIELIANLPKSEVGITITETNDKISRFMEVKAPSASSRLKTLTRLNKAGINTYAFIGPLLPHFRFSTDSLEKLFCAIANTGTKSIYIEHINLKNYILKKIESKFQDGDKEIRDIYKNARSDHHKQSLEVIIQPLIKKYGFHLRLGELLTHK